MTKKKWIVGTRGSKLALKQTGIVIEKLNLHYPDYEFSIKTIRTKGDTVWDKPLHQIEGQGLFVREIEEALLDKEIDMAVHSVKDLPAELAKGLRLEAIPEREDARDAFVSKAFSNFNGLPEGARIGTGSLRRRAQLLHHNNSLEIVPLRGNIDTRLKKLDTGVMDAIILAGAGLKRMGLAEKISQTMPIDIMTPSCGQGAIGIETRMDDECAKLLAPINDSKTYQEISIERTLLKLIGGGCHLPLGLHAFITGEAITLYVSMGNEKGMLCIHKHFNGSAADIPGLVSTAFHEIKPFLL